MNRTVSGMIAIALLLCAGCDASPFNVVNNDQPIESEDQLAGSLVIALESKDGDNANHTLAQRIAGFAKQYPGVTIKIEGASGSDQIPLYDKWRQEGETMPDLVEVTPNQMEDLYLAGKIEALDKAGYYYDEDAHRNLQAVVQLTSVGDHLLGIPVSINPWVAFYKQEAFQNANVPLPDASWSWDVFFAIGQKLQDAGNKVNFPLTTDTLEIVSRGMGSAIISPDRERFHGYLDSDTAIAAADRLAKSNFGSRNVNDGFYMYDPKVALSIHPAFRTNLNSSNYEDIMHEDGMDIAPLPSNSETTGLNPAQVTGLSLSVASTHKVLAIRLLQYLMNDDSNLYRQLAAQTNETYSPASPPLQLDSKASSIVLHEMRNAAPLALQINLEYLFPFSASKYWYLGTDYIDRIRRGGSSEQLLKQYADMMDNKFKFVYD